MALFIFTAEPENFVPVELKKSAEELGVVAEIVDITKCVMIEQVTVQGSATEPADSGYVMLIQGKEGETSMVRLNVQPGDVIIPRLNEHHLEIKLGVLERLKQNGAILYNSVEGMGLCNDKLRSQIVLNSAGIKTPSSFIVQSQDDIEAVVNQLEEMNFISYPIILKTLRGTHGIGVMKLDSRSSLVSVAQTLAKDGQDFMIQQFCKHERSARIIMVGEQLLAANLRGQPSGKDEFRTNSHLGSETEPYTPSQNETELAVKIVRLFNVNFCAIDYIIMEDGTLMVLEVNGSPGLENIQKNWPDRNLALDVVKAACPPPEPHQDDCECDECGYDRSIGSDVALATEPAQAPTNQLAGVASLHLPRLLANPVDARVDTGARFSSIHADNVEMGPSHVKFTHDGTTYQVPLARTVQIKSNHAGDPQHRPVIKLDAMVNGQRVPDVEFTLADRAHMKYPALIGQNLIKALGLPVVLAPQEPPIDADEPSEEYDEE